MQFCCCINLIAATWADGGLVIRGLVSCLCILLKNKPVAIAVLTGLNVIAKMTVMCTMALKISIHVFKGLMDIISKSCYFETFWIITELPVRVIEEFSLLKTPTFIIWYITFIRHLEHFNSILLLILWCPLIALALVIDLVLGNWHLLISKFMLELINQATD